MKKLKEKTMNKQELERMAKCVDVNPDELQAIFESRSTINVKTAIKVAQHLGVSIDTLCEYLYGDA